MRNQSIVGSKLPDLSEAAEQEKGNSLCSPSCPYKTECALSSTFSSVAKGVHFLNLRENLLFQSENDDDLFLFLSSVPPIYWQLHNTDINVVFIFHQQMA